MKEKSILKLICKWRTELMGMAILWVVLFHSKLQLGGILDTVQTIGYGGVDIFFLLSGIGLYYSLRKSEKLLPFYGRRARRIFPAYLPFIAVWLIYMIQTYEWRTDIIIKVIAGNLFMTGWLSGIGGQFNWYVQVIFWVYLLSPLFYRLVVSLTKKWQKGLLLVWAVLLGIAFWTDDNLLMGVSRLPVFLVGMLWAHEENLHAGSSVLGKHAGSSVLGKHAGSSIPGEKTGGSVPGEHAGSSVLGKNAGSSVPGKKAIALSLLAVTGMAVLLVCYFNLPDYVVWGFGIWWYPFILIAPGLCFLLALFMEGMDRIRGVKLLLKPVKLIGKASFEIYLLHIAAFDILPGYLGVSSNRRWLALTAAAVAAGVLYHLLVEAVMKRIERRKKRLQNEGQ